MGILAKTKGTVYASEAERIKFEDHYRNSWIAKNLEDVQAKPELKIRSHFKIEKKKKVEAAAAPVLPKKAKIVNNMLSEGKSPKQVAKTLFENVKYITRLISKYNLPNK